MNLPFINMHGPEHHILDGAALLTALYHHGLEFNLEEALDEMIQRGSMMPGAICGKWGVCGSVSSIGAAMSILHETGPLSSHPYYKDHMNYTSKALCHLYIIGGPRCCKRNAFLSMNIAVEFMKEHWNIHLPQHTIQCDFSLRNQQCLKSKCPFHRKLKVAFICVHNSCRSQIAEALGKHMASDYFDFYSAGTETKPQINQDAVRLIKNHYGIDMNTTQYSKLLNELPELDLVITMGCNVLCPTLPCKYREDWGLEDPTGQSDEEFMKVIHQIEENINRLIEQFS